ncbi:MAG: hypothetical protein KAJ54_00565 [Candidatus Aenigmarchaeota archaeon]|nr:hypothetical protein [Candidatus Aenigmarchaeota archaeon]
MTDIETISENMNILLKRKEIEAKVFSEGPTPRKDEIISMIAKKYKTKETHIDLNSIHQKTGSHFSVCKIKIYDKPIRDSKPKEEETKATDEPAPEQKIEKTEETEQKTSEEKPVEENKTEETKDGDKKENTEQKDGE